jgi:hypothetical protein
MNFNEAVQAMLKGIKIKASYWEPTEYIELDGENNIVDEHGCRYIFSNPDFRAVWDFSYPMAGTMLKHRNGNFYKLVVCPDNTYSIVNTETYRVVREHIGEDVIEPLLRVEGYTSLYMCD